MFGSTFGELCRGEIDVCVVKKHFVLMETPVLFGMLIEQFVCAFSLLCLLTLFAIRVVHPPTGGLNVMLFETSTTGTMDLCNRL